MVMDEKNTGMEKVIEVKTLLTQASNAITEAAKAYSIMGKGAGYAYGRIVDAKKAIDAAVEKAMIVKTLRQ